MHAANKQSCCNAVCSSETVVSCEQAREVMDAMQKDAEVSQVQLLKVDGGASNNDLLMQMQADALQVSIVKPVAP